MGELLKKGYKPIEVRGNNLVIVEKDGQEEVCELTENEIIKFKHWLRKLNLC